MKAVFQGSFAFVGLSAAFVAVISLLELWLVTEPRQAAAASACLAAACTVGILSGIGLAVIAVWQSIEGLRDDLRYYAECFGRVGGDETAPPPPVPIPDAAASSRLR